MTHLLNYQPMTTETTEPQTALAPVESVPQAAEFDALESLVRLIVGGAIEAPAELVARLQQWEEQAAQTGDAHSLAPTPAATEQLRYALVGLALAAHDQARSGASRFGRLVDVSAGRLLRAARPLTGNPLMQPVQRRYENLIAEGETAVNRWIERGRAEEPRSRLVARQAVNLTIDEVIQHLAENPEVRDLVTQQTYGIADEVVGGVRSRTVTADIVLERLARGLLRRPPREQLPPPIPEVMAQADRINLLEE